MQLAEMLRHADADGRRLLITAREKAIFDDRAFRQALYGDQPVVAHVFDAILGKFQGSLIEHRRAAAAAQQRVVGDFVGRAAVGGDWKPALVMRLPCTRTRLDASSPMPKRASPASLSMRLSSTSAALLPISKTPSCGPRMLLPAMPPPVEPRLPWAPRRATSMPRMASC